MYAALYGELVYGGNSYIKLFEYKHAMYAIVNDPNEVSPPKLFMNGLRGVMKSNAANLYASYLDQTVNPADVVGKTIFIYNGAGRMSVSHIVRLLQLPPVGRYWLTLLGISRRTTQPSG